MDFGLICPNCGSHYIVKNGSILDILPAVKRAGIPLEQT